MLTHQGQLQGKNGEDLDNKLKGFMNDLIYISGSKEIPRKLISGIWKLIVNSDLRSGRLISC